MHRVLDHTGVSQEGRAASDAQSRGVRHECGTARNCATTFIWSRSDQPSLPAEGWKPGQWKSRRLLVVVGNSIPRREWRFKIVLLVCPLMVRLPWWGQVAWKHASHFSKLLRVSAWGRGVHSSYLTGPESDQFRVPATSRTWRWWCSNIGLQSCLFMSFLFCQAAGATSVGILS